MVCPRIVNARASDMPRKGAQRNPPAKTAVPGRARAFRSMMAVSPVGVGTTGGTRMARLWSPGSGKLSAANRMYFANQGSAQSRIRTEATANGDQALSTAPTECRRSAGASAAAASTITFFGRQTRRNPTITSSENAAATMSTRLVSTKFDQ